jgi:flagellar hook-associated protein 3 FlgL
VINTTTSATLTSGAATSQGRPSVDGAQVTITGSPAGNDTFDIAPSTRQSAFKTITDLAAALESNADGSLSEAAFRTALTQGMAGIDQAHDHVLSVRTGFGARLRELDSLSALTQDQSLYYQRELSRLTDLDLAGR